MKAADVAEVLLGSLKRTGLPGLRNLFLAFLNLKLEPLKMSSYPAIVQVEPTVYCNLECVMCANPLSVRQRKHMTFAEFKNIINSMPFLRKISLVGTGEPLLNPDLFKMVSYSKSKGILIGFATNAVLLDERNSKNILDSCVDWLNISIDSADKNSFETIRKGARFDTVTKNTKRFMEMRGKSGLPDVSIWFVIMKENISDLPGVIKLSRSLGISKVSAQLEHNWSNDKIKGDMEERYSGDFYNRIKEFLREAKDVADKEGVSFYYVNVPDPHSARACQWPWKSCYVTVEGFVTPCCIHGSNPDVINFGNIFEKSFSQIWNSPKYQEFRKRLKSNVPPEICIGCTSYYKKIVTD